MGNTQDTPGHVGGACKPGARRMPRAGLSAQRDGFTAGATPGPRKAKREPNATPTPVGGPRITQALEPPGYQRKELPARRITSSTAGSVNAYPSFHPLNRGPATFST